MNPRLCRLRVRVSVFALAVAFTAFSSRIMAGDFTPIHINFQPAAAEVPEGYLPDSGANFGDRGNGYSYGWNGTNNSTVERNVHADQRYDTFCKMLKTTPRTWEIALPNGNYEVYVVMGDPSTKNMYNHVYIEGVLFSDLDGKDNFDDYTANIAVNDGFLTLIQADGALNARICYIDISQGSGAPNQPPVADAGSDQELLDTDGNGVEPVSLSGAGSYDPDGNIVSYIWSEGGATLTTGPTPTISLGIGTHTITLTVADDKGVIAHDDVIVKVAQNFDLPVLLPGRIEAENYRLGGEGVGYHDTTAGNAGNVYRFDDVDIQTCTDTGTGYNIRTVAAGEWLAYRIQIPAPGTCQMTARVASAQTSDKRLHVEIDGVNVTGPIVFNTGGAGAQAWRNAVSGFLPVEPGLRNLKIVMETANFNLNYLDIAYNAYPVAVVACIHPAPQTAQTVPLSGSASYDPDGDEITNYVWTLVSAPEGAGTVTLDMTDPVHPSFMPVLPGDYTFHLVVTDERGLESTDETSPDNTVTVSVAGLPAPVLDAPAPGFTTNDATVLLSWLPVEGAEFYYLNVTNDTLGLVLYSGWIAAPAVSQWVALMPDSSYTWKVKAYDAGSGAWSVWSASRTLAVDRFPAPALLSPADGVDLFANEVTLSWEAIPEATHYYVSATDTTAGTTAYNGWVVAPATSKAIPVMPGHGYSWRVKSFKGSTGSWSDYSETRTFSIGVFPAPTPLTPTDGANLYGGQVHLTWSAVVGANYYYLAVTNTTTGTPAYGGWITAPATGVTIPLLPGTHYAWTVKAYDSDSGLWSEASATWSFDAGELSPPALLSPANGAAQAATWVDLEWDAVADADYYYLVVTDLAMGVPLIATWIDSVGTSYGAAYPTGGSYSWQVKAFHEPSQSWSAWSELRTFSIGVFPSPAPLAPADAGNVYAGQCVFSWDPVAGADYYYLTVVNTSTGTNACAKWIASPATSAPVTLAAGVTYAWTVKSYDADSGLWSAGETPRSVSAVALGVPAPAAPAPGAVAASPVLFQWSAVADADYYYLYVTDDGAGTTALATWVVGPATSRSAALAPGRSYTWQVKAYCSSAQLWSAYSPAQGFSTAP